MFAEEDENDVKIRESYVVAHLDVSVFNGAYIMGRYLCYEKNNNVFSKQVRHKLGCTVTEKRLEA